MFIFTALIAAIFSSEYLQQYSPPLESGSALRSASHYQRFESTKNKDPTASLKIFPEKYFGIEVSYSRESSSLSGISSDYEVFLRYISRPPPSYDPVEVFFNRSNPWPNPPGYLNLKILSLNPAVRFLLLRRWQLHLSAGLASFFLKEELGPIAFTRFWLGGHSVLFSEKYKLLARLIPNHRLGWNGGASLSAGVINGVDLTLDLRYYRTPAIPLQLEAVDYDKDYTRQGIEPVRKLRAHLNLGRTLFQLSFFSLKLGIKIAFL
ncbi:MAG: hypothetical protein ACUVR0_08995 [Candidatus Aminicenantales bacterium]